MGTEETTPQPRDEFRSEEDLDLKNMSYEELIKYWNHWLMQAQATNGLDKCKYSHGVIMGMEEPH